MSVMPVNPTRFRDVIQRQIATTVTRATEEIRDFSTDGKDGRYLASYPTTVSVKLSDEFGRFYHIVGVSVISDLSVVGP